MLRIMVETVQVTRLRIEAVRSYACVVSVLLFELLFISITVQYI